jgi:uncharacterized membrane protein YraQ (UPF0718 family)
MQETLNPNKNHNLAGQGGLKGIVVAKSGMLYPFLSCSVCGWVARHLMMLN